MSFKDHISFMVVPENSLHPLKLRMTIVQFYILLGLLAVFFLLFLIGVGMGGKYVKLYFETRSLTAENSNLKRQLEKVRQIELKIAQLSEVEKFIKTIVGANSNENKTADRISNDIRLLQSSFNSNELAKVSDRARYIPRGLPQDGVISSNFAANKSIYANPHYGVDISLPAGKSVFATAAGRVSFAGFDNDYGNFVIIDHLNGYTTGYGHLSRIIVRKGDTIDRNSIIGFSGSTGKSIASHIHYQLTKDGEYIDPLKEIRK
jgi:murein DD-endopeptidase MepM/ murein hydrolase activator NlpD